MLFHIVNGRSYGPARPGESISQYKARVREAYGNLRGVKFVLMHEPGEPIYVLTGQSDRGKVV